MPTEEEERKAKAERAKKLLAQRKKKANAAASTAASALSTTSASPSATDIDAGTASARTSLSIDDRSEVAPPPKGEARRKKAVVETGGGEEGVAKTETEELKAAITEPVSGLVNATPELEVVNAPLAIAETPLQPVVPIQSSSDLQQTISLLIAERTDLQTQLTARNVELSSAQANQKLVEEGQAIITRLQSEKEELEARVKSVEENARELPLVRGELSTAREELDVLRKAEGELQARVQDTEGKLGEEVKKNADSLAGLERSLERARDREGELEKEVARLRQRETELQAELDTKLGDTSNLQTEVKNLRQQLEAEQSEHRDLEAEHSILSATHSTLQTSHSSLSSELSKLHESHTTQAEQLRTAQSSLSISQTELERATTSLATDRKRAEAAEKKRLALQSENDNLLQQLEEMREKVTVVMGEKADLAEELDSAKGQIRKVDIDQAVKKLESELEASASRVQLLTRQLADLQSAYAASQKERNLAAGYSGSPNRDLAPPSMNRTSSVNRSVDAILPANVRHKRQVSLTALKARMGSSFSRGGMDSLAEHPGERKQFGDEIMFCCPACEGDLITL